MYYLFVWELVAGELVVAPRHPRNPLSLQPERQVRPIRHSPTTAASPPSGHPAFPNPKPGLKPWPLCLGPFRTTHPIHRITIISPHLLPSLKGSWRKAQGFILG